MKILMICKYPPIQGGVSAEAYWTANTFAELGHSVFVLTNAEEAETSYRATLDQNDQVLLNGFRNKDCIRLYSTTIDKKHVYIPQNNPSISKLVSLGLEIIRDFQPDFIYSFYVEPYGMTAMILSGMTGVPYSIRHAGSDIGRLMLTPQLKTVHEQVFKRANAVLTSERHHETFKSFGVSENRFVRSVSTRLPGDVFHSEGRLERGGPIRIGMYGKVGRAKGTTEALRAIASLGSQDIPVLFHAHWGGRELPEYLAVASRLGLESNIAQIDGFIPHWKMPGFIRNCDIVLFLESNFKITFHTPGVPFEAWACGAHLITTREIADKPHVKRFVNDANTTTVESPVTGESVTSAIKLAIKKDPVQNNGVDASLLSIHTRQNTHRMLAQIRALL